MEKLVAKVTHYFNKINVAILEITEGELAVEDTIHVKGHTSDFTQKIGSMQVEHEPIQKAKKGDNFGLKVDAPVHEHDLVYLVTE